ncbi:MAG TPA: radical SAM family heme chaperone HemW [Nitrospira sp.]|nr:radical SAM family heme chaperone HemW [Nitrospira sp.]
MTRPFGLYIHIPFCRQRCDFCSFYLELHREPAAERFLSALKREIALYGMQPDLRRRAVCSVYFGGGTPTVLGSDSLIAILTEVQKYFGLSNGCEITVEAHPSTVSDAAVGRLAEAGVTRMSFGAESMNDAELLRVGRPGVSADTVTAVSQARSAGITNVNLDLMYGLPGQSLSSWKRTLERCAELEPSHLSCYALTVEPGTKFASHVRLGRVPMPDEDVQNAMDEGAEGFLAAAGYERYEISNYARPGFACRHNLLYWTGGDYLGLGPSGQSFMSGRRFGNVADLAAYETALAEARLPVIEEATLTDAERLRDAVVFGLRLVRGIPSRSLREHAGNFGYASTIADCQRAELIEIEGERARLTAKGRRYADFVAERLY